MSHSSQTLEFRTFRVLRKVRETAAITSFELALAEGGPLRPFQPGQFVTLRIPRGEDPPLVRNYSISNGPGETGFYRITVKRQLSPLDRPDVPHGLGSGFLHDHLEAGDRLDMADPAGDFHLQAGTTRPVLLLSGGVGQTPLVSMAHALAQDGRRRTRFVHCCRNGAEHALAAELRALAAGSPNLSLHTVYSQPDPDDHLPDPRPKAGRLSKDSLQAILPQDDHEVYLCGPSGFMAEMYLLLRSLGIAQERIFYEHFGPATLLSALEKTDDRQGGIRPDPEPDSAVPFADAPADGAAMLVTFTSAGTPAAWDGTSRHLLELAEKLGLAPESSCRSGICGSCTYPLLSGEVDYIRPILTAPLEGEILLCSCKPKGDIVIDL